MPGARGRGRRPSGIAQINRGSPQANGLAAFWVPDVTLTRLVVNRPNTVVAIDGTPSSVPCLLGGMACRFTGSSSSEAVKISTSAPVTLVINTLPLTIVGWARFTSAGADHDVNTMVSCSTSFSDYSYYLSVGGGHLNAYSVTGGWLDGSVAIPANQWFQWAVVLNADGKRLYVNGQLDSTTASVSLNANATSVFVGDRADAVGSSFSGDIAEVRWYTRTLSAAEVWSLYDPRTRWDLYWVPSRRVYGFVSTPPPGGFLSRLTLLRAG